MLIAGRRNIRSWMPDQHRSFYANLQIIYVSIRDNKGRPRALALTGPAGFIQSPNSTELTITPQQSLDRGARQPLTRPFLQQQGCLCQTVKVPSRLLIFPYHADFAAGKGVGLLGLEMHTRRRNRANGVITAAGEGFVQIHILESFGNCPKYIQVVPFAHHRMAMMAGLSTVSPYVVQDCLACDLTNRQVLWCRQGGCAYCQNKRRHRTAQPQCQLNSPAAATLVQSRQLSYIKQTPSSLPPITRPSWTIQSASGQGMISVTEAGPQALCSSMAWTG